MMFPVAWFQNLNSSLPPCRVTAYVLMGGCGAVLYFSIKSGGRRPLGVLPALIYVLAGALYLLSSNDLLQKRPSAYLLVIAVLALVVHICFQHALQYDPSKTDSSALKHDILSPIIVQNVSTPAATVLE